MGTIAVISQILLLLAGIFLMIVVLLQRGRGGGLAGAFGGLGGQSAFGTKAGDVFTRITIVMAIIWVILAGGSGYFLRASSQQKGEAFGQNETVEEGAGAVSDDEAPAMPVAPPVESPGAADDFTDLLDDGAADSADSPDTDADPTEPPGEE